jgi:hypothetical protein
MAGLPKWEQGTPGVLCAAGPHPIPISTAVRAGDDRLLFALGSGRETLSRLREDPRSAFCLLGQGVAFTAHGRVEVVADSLEAAASVAAVELRVERVQDHLADGRTELLDGARWRWRDEGMTDAEDAIVAELGRLGEESGR